MTKNNHATSGIRAQFKDLNDQHPSQWPAAPQITAYAEIVISVLIAGWQFYWTEELATLDQVQQEEIKLKKSFQQKTQQAISLEVLKQQKKLVSEYVAELEKQLPNKSEMDALLSDINQAGLGRGLQFELFKPGHDSTKNYYAELPIDIKIIGKYHDIGQFASDIAALPRIVSLHNLKMTFVKKEEGDKNIVPSLILEAVVKTFRYLEKEELQHNPTSDNGAPKGGQS